MLWYCLFVLSASLPSTGFVIPPPGLQGRSRLPKLCVGRLSRHAYSRASTELRAEGQAQETERISLKRELLEKLTEDRDTKDPEIAELINRLSALNPTPKGAVSPLWIGHFVQRGQLNSPGGRRVGDKILYTLGRSSFDQFKPGDLTLQFDRIENIIRETAETGTGGDGNTTYTVRVCFTSADEKYPTIKGFFDTEGKSYVEASDKGGLSSPLSTSRRMVLFERGRLRRNEAECDEATWDSVFSPESQKKAKWSFSAWLLKWTFGRMLSIKREESAQPGEQSYVFGRPAPGSLDILYMDDDMRITKGNRGSVVVVTRL
uniref:Plastid lipid-associated protein/fibrillin conserved domain-containing protein n=1 Tax=Chromera velia CCMP2878 TaxID=1169474 RepID=A0A0G4GVH7_9ALVE|eukprot:Cvel_23540.t1-p1 / transcript=Cvel_23540.t1 / gene=Cvel_23540 / organism=Chromera_velia_CCMP2878 / gene_product=hypothetical protein / transcript_product=hypothetical protein / location=Cvel_scaffold2437:4838-6010(+) / protein_length=317 / sequence_SO=supercontig / SO=protein_coding / is_pseudo=false